jgi:hypothetical protein
MLLDHGIPVIVCRPRTGWKPGHTKSDLIFPTGWQNLTADQCELSKFRPGIDTLAMVGGHGIDAIDVDGGAGGRVDHMPPFKYFGSCSTPSSTPEKPSTHYYVRSTSIGRMTPLKTGAGHVGDYVGGTTQGGGRMLAYLEGSSRPKYPGLTYTEIEPLDLDALFDSEPDDVLIDTLLCSGGSFGAGPAQPAASKAQVRRYRAPRGPKADASSLADIASSGQCAYGRKAMKLMLGIPIGAKGRHGWTIATTNRVVALINLGCCTVADLDAVEARLHELKPEGGTDFNSVLSWAITNVDAGKGCKRHMRLNAKPLLGGPVIGGPHAEEPVADEPLTDEPAGEEPAGEEPQSDEVVPLDLNDPLLWGAMPQLQAIHDWARYSCVAPWVLLGAILTIIDASIPPYVVLPPVVGRPASLNTFCAVVGPSGAGKSSAFTLAQYCIDLQAPNVKLPGTGEGLVKQFVAMVEEPIEGTDNDADPPKGRTRAPRTRLVQRQHAESVLMFISEVATLNAVGFGRGGATLLPMLTAGGSGEALGASNADPQRSLHLGQHQYRLAVLVGLQPKLSGLLIEAGADGGFPQRFLFLPCVDEGAPSVDEWPEGPHRIGRPAGLVDVEKTWPRVHAPTQKLLGFTPLDDDAQGAVEQIELTVCKAAERAIRVAAVSRLRGEESDLDGHALLMREKVAALMSVLFGGDGSIDEYVWEQAGFVMKVSDQTRTGIIEVLDSQRVEVFRDRGKGMAQTSSAADSEGTAITAVRTRLLRLLSTPQTHRQLMQRFAGPARTRAGAALDDMVSDGSVVLEGKLYRSGAAA